MLVSKKKAIYIVNILGHSRTISQPYFVRFLYYAKTA